MTGESPARTHNAIPGGADRLRSFIERIEKLESERADLGADIREVFSEAKGAGFDTKVMRAAIRLRKMDQAERAEMEALLDVYMDALGDLKGTPLGEAAIEGAGLKARVGAAVDKFAAENGLTVRRGVKLFAGGKAKAKGKR